MYQRGYLHRNVSINNTMIYEEVLPDGTIRVRGLLIDFDYAIKVDELGRTPGPGDRTVSVTDQSRLLDLIAHTQGTLPFMATELLHATDDAPVQHTPAHDLESFVYLLCWIVTLYDSPKSQLRKDSSKNWLWKDGMRVMIYPHLRTTRRAVCRLTATSMISPHIMPNSSHVLPCYPSLFANNTSIFARLARLLKVTIISLDPNATALWTTQRHRSTTTR